MQIEWSRKNWPYDKYKQFLHSCSSSKDDIIRCVVDYCWRDVLIVARIKTASHTIQNCTSHMRQIAGARVPALNRIMNCILRRFTRKTMPCFHFQSFFRHGTQNHFHIMKFSLHLIWSLLTCMFLFTWFDIMQICQTRAWMLSMGFTLAYGAMFSKVWRVHRFTTKQKQDPKVC